MIDTAERTPPQDLVAEQSVLGALLLSRDAIADIIGTVRTSDFYKPAHATIFNTITDLYGRGEPADPVTVLAALTRTGQTIRIGGAPYLHTLMTTVPTAASAGYYARIVTEKAALRRIVEAGTRLVQTAYSGDADPFEAVQEARDLLERVDLGAGSAPPSMADLMPAWLDALEAGDTTRTLPTGYLDLDSLLAGGLRGGQLIVVGARPGVGKSVMLGDIAREAAADGKRVLWHSLEMPKAEVQARFVSAVCRIPLDRVMGKRLSDDDWQRISAHMAEINPPSLHIDDRPSVTVGDMHRTARGVRPDLLLLDYLQLVQPGKHSGSRQEDVAGISRALKLLARDLACPVVVAAQLNRSPTARADSKPRLSDFRESGAVEADADVALLIDRDPDNETQGTTAEVIVAKNRGGATGTVSLAFLGHYASFGSMTGWAA